MSVERSPPGSAGGGVGDLARKVRDLLAPVSRRRVFPAGSLLWREGDSNGMLVAIQAGRVKIYRVLPNGNAVTIYLFGPGDVFGFMPFLDGGPNAANAEALDEVVASVTPREALLEIFRANPELAMALIGLLAHRLRDAFDRIQRSSVPEALTRVASAIASLVPERAAARKRTVVELPVRARDFAGAVGVVPESLSRALTKLVEARVLRRLGPRRFEVLDPAALRRAARGGG